MSVPCSKLDLLVTCFVIRVAIPVVKIMDLDMSRGKWSRGRACHALLAHVITRLFYFQVHISTAQGGSNRKLSQVVRSRGRWTNT